MRSTGREKATVCARCAERARISNGADFSEVFKGAVSTFYVARKKRGTRATRWRCQRFAFPLLQGNLVLRLEWNSSGVVKTREDATTSHTDGQSCKTRRARIARRWRLEKKVVCSAAFEILPVQLSRLWHPFPHAEWLSEKIGNLGRVSALPIFLEFKRWYSSLI